MPHPDEGGSRITRRDFSRRAASVAAAAAGFLLAGATGAQEASPTPPEKREPAPPADGKPQAPPKPAEPPAPATPKGLDESVALVLLAAPGLPAADHKELRDQVKSVMDLSKDLRSHKVVDGTEPDFVFRALLPQKPEGRRG